MKSFNTVRRLALAGLALGVVLVGAAPARAQVDQAELAQVRAAIEAEGLGWTAGETSAAALSREERRARLMQGATPDELYQQLAGDPSSNPDFSKLPADLPLPAPDDPVFSWRDVDGEDWTSPIANQGMCGACTIFAAVASIECALNVAFGSADLDYNLSEQNLLSCTSGVSCDGGMDAALGLIQASNVGLPDEYCHPYTATDGSCSEA